MSACACGAPNPCAVVTLTTDASGEWDGGKSGNVHERMCDLCLARWEGSVNYRLAWQHVKEGREGAALSEFRSWQAVNQRRSHAVGSEAR